MGIITIDGNIGCGKTGVLNYLHKTFKLPVDLEPVDNWQPYLNNMYNNKNNTFNFQVRIWLDRCWIQKNNINNNNILVERSPYFIKNTFIEIAKENNLINNAEYEILLDLHNKTDKMWENNTYIYLKSNPDACFERIHKRNRLSEDKITIEYIIRLHELHEEKINILKNLVSENNIHIINVENKTIAMIATEVYQLIK